LASVSAKLALSNDQTDVLRLGIERLRQLLPSDFRIDVSPDHPLTPSGRGDRLDALITVQDPAPGGGQAQLVFEIKTRFTPRDVEAVLGGRLPLVRSLTPDSAFMVLAPWLSPRTRSLLADRDIGYLDLTGNALFRVSRPTIYVQSTGADQDPNPPPHSGASLRGAAAGRVVRLLVDVRPPYTATAIAQAVGVSVAQVSRLLATLDREALVERGHRGLVVTVDWSELLRRRAASYGLLKTNRARAYVSSSGPSDVLRRLQAEPDLYRAVTGSFAAAMHAPVAAPSQLTIYVDDFDRAERDLRLLPTDRGADVILLHPYDPVVLEGSDKIGGLSVVAPSQLALDCLSGNGRMPTEGEALLDWMSTHDDLWRRSGIQARPLG
jgi:hypothetical protein